MGNILSKDGISPVKSKLDAIRLASRRKDVSQLRSFLGMLNYYLKTFRPKCTHCTNFLATRLNGFGAKRVKFLFYGRKSEQVVVHP